MDPKYYRVTYGDKGVYQALKENVTDSEWLDFLANSGWLPKPVTYSNGDRSYFTEAGYKEFKKKTLPYIEKHLDPARIAVYEGPLPKEPSYTDEYQAIVGNGDVGDIMLRTVNPRDPKDMTKLYRAIRMAEDASRVPHVRKDRILDKLETDVDRAYMFQRGLRILGAARISSDPSYRYIKDFAIFKPHQGKGYGTVAFQKLLAEVPGEGPIELDVGGDNARAQHLYENAGFKKMHQWKSTGNWHMQKDAAMTTEERKLRRLARPFYPAEGRRSWEHINQVMRNAEMMTQGLENRPLNLQEKAAILFHDCAIKARGTGKEHGRYGRETAIPLLLSTGFFTKKQLDEIGTAIVEHDELNGTGAKFSNTTADVLASGDANPPDLPWMLNKFYTWQIRNNPDKNTWADDIYETATGEFGESSTEKFPDHYNRFHGSRVAELRKRIGTLSKDEMWDMVQKYRKKHHMGDMDLRLGSPPMFQPA